MGSYFYFSRQYRLYVYIVGFVGADLCVCPDVEYIVNGASLATSLVIVNLSSDSHSPTTQLLRLSVRVGNYSSPKRVCIIKLFALQGAQQQAAHGLDNIQHM